MNKNRRSKLSTAKRAIKQAEAIVRACIEEEEDAIDNLPDSMRYSDKAEDMKNYSDQMRTAEYRLQQSEDILYDIILN